MTSVKPSAVAVVSEIKLGEVAVQMGFAAVLINALHAALEDGKDVLDRVGVDEAADVLTALRFV